MRTTHRYLIASLLALGVGVATPACASQGGFYNQRYDYRDFQRRAYDNGYRTGVINGERDGTSRRNFEYRNDRDYRDADRGYRRGEGDRGDYRRFFRQGFETGYAEGFNRAARSYGNGYPRNNGPYNYPGSNGPYNYPGQAIPRGGYGYGSPAAQVGYRDGLEAGRKDARDGDRSDPVRSSRYRSADHDYNNRYGSKDDYKREYRAAFEQGYREGYGRRF